MQAVGVYRCRELVGILYSDDEQKIIAAAYWLNLMRCTLNSTSRVASGEVIGTSVSTLPWCILVGIGLRVAGKELRIRI